MSHFTQADLLVLVKLIFSHVVADFALQPDSWVADRNQHRLKSRYLYVHGLVHGILAYVLVKNVFVALTVAITHTAIDAWKAHQPADLKFFLLDQAMHVVVLTACWLFLAGARINPDIVLNNYRLMVYLTGYFLVTQPMGIIIGLATRNWRNLDRQNQPDDWNDLQRAGRWIGILERIIIVTFVLLEQYEAIGLLIAGKSIIRFKEEDKRKSEYFLFGTLVSFALSILVALAIKGMLMLK